MSIVAVVTDRAFARKTSHAAKSGNSRKEIADGPSTGGVGPSIDIVADLETEDLAERSWRADHTVV